MARTRRARPAALTTAALTLAVLGTALAACSSSASTGAGRAVTTGAPATSSTPAPSTSASSSASASASPSHTVVTIPPPSAPLRTATVTAGTTAYAIDVWVQKSDADCAAHAHGTPVLDYLRAHPCTGMIRQLATTTVNGRPVGFSAASVSFAGSAPTVYTTAGKFRTLVLADNTGSVNDLLAEGYRLPAGPSAVPTDEAFAALSQDAGVTVYDAWYLSGTTPVNDAALEKMLQSIYLQY
ncbi:MAG TPA: hypothetical protein VGH01_04410 [Jatrophihabitantaceae bacterium]|jgi:hypothetical protein